MRLLLTLVDQTVTNCEVVYPWRNSNKHDALEY